MKRLLTINQAKKAIYLDFEGLGSSIKNSSVKEQPHLAGIYRPKEDDRKATYQCICFKKDWSPIARGNYCATVFDFASFFQKLADTVDKSAARIIYWSEHEEKVLKQFLQGQNKEVLKKLTPQLTNLKLVAKDYYASRKKLVAHKNLEYRKLDDCFPAMYAKRKPFKTVSIYIPDSDYFYRD